MSASSMHLQNHRCHSLLITDIITFTHQIANYPPLFDLSKWRINFCCWPCGWLPCGENVVADWVSWNCRGCCWRRNVEKLWLSASINLNPDGDNDDDDDDDNDYNYDDNKYDEEVNNEEQLWLSATIILIPDDDNDYNCDNSDFYYDSWNCQYPHW